MKTVYMLFSTDIIHSGHINIIEEASILGDIIAGVLCDECVEIYEKYPLIPIDDRMRILQNIKGIKKVVVQNDIYYDDILEEWKPDYVVHGDNWMEGYQRPIREQVIAKLKEWDGVLIEIPYYKSDNLSILSGVLQDRAGLPEVRRQRLRYELKSGQVLKIIEAHDGLSALIAENCKVKTETGMNAFDGIWISSLCDSTIKGKPDIELVDLTSRLQKVDEILEVSTKPIIFDADTGGMTEHFAYNIRTLERTGVSAVIIEDKKGLKRNSLLGNEVVQCQEDVKEFCRKIEIGKKSLNTRSFMIIARIESLVLEQGMDEALIRAYAYVAAGADGIMIHSRKNVPDEVFCFCDEFRKTDRKTPLIIVPTTYNAVKEEECALHGINMVIYANHLLRAAFPAMQKVAESILKNHSSCEADEYCMSIKKILSLIPMSE